MRIEGADLGSVKTYSAAQEFDRALALQSAQSQTAPMMPRDPGGGGEKEPGRSVGEAIGNLIEMAVYGFSIKTSKADDGHKVVTIQAGANADNIRVRQGPDGTLTITDNAGQAFNLKVDKDTEIVIEGGDGNDTVDATGTTDSFPSPRNDGGNDGKPIPYKLTINGGAGNDAVYDGDGGDVLIGGEGDDIIVGNGGNDYVDGQRGADTLVGGDGKDVVYGGYGTDALYGDAGADYLDGGQDNDVCFGGEGCDIVSGGRGDDYINGGWGRDVLITSFGQDTVSDRGYDGQDKIYAKEGDTIDVDPNSVLYTVDPNKTADGKPLGSSITIEGSDEFKDRMNADIDTMSGLPLGQFLLGSLDTSGHHTTIREFSENNGGASPVGDPDLASPDENGRPGPGTDAEISINPSMRHLYNVPDDWTDTPPIVVLFHEMGHAQDFVNGTLIPPDQMSQNPGGPPHLEIIKTPNGTVIKRTETVRSLERSVVGLPYDQDGNPATNEPNHRLATENNFREQLGLPDRPYY